MSGRSPALALLAIAFATAAARLPLMWLERPFDDEVLYALVGHQWLLGYPPYAVLWDVKPPGLFALYAGAEALTGDPLLGPRLLPLTAGFFTGVALWRLGIAWLGDARAGLLAAVLYPPYSLLRAGVMGTAELLLAPFVAFGLLLAGRRGVWSALFAGLLLGIAGTIKQTAIFEAILGLGVVVAVNRPKSLMACFPVCAYCLAGLAPVAAFGAYFAWAGHSDEFIQAVALSALQRTQGDGISLTEGFVRFLPMLQPFLPLIVLSAFAITERRWFAMHPDRARFLWVFAWFAMAAVGILLLRSMYQRYFLVLLPTLALGAGLFLSEFQRRVPRLATAPGVAVFLLALLAFPFVWISARAEWPTGDRDVRAIVAKVKDLGLTAGATSPELYVADHEAAIYLLAAALPPTRFAFSQHLTCDFPLPPGVRAEAELERVMMLRPRIVVISAWRSRMICTRPERMTIIDRHLEEHYRLVERIGDPGNSVEIFMRTRP